MPTPQQHDKGCHHVAGAQCLMKHQRFQKGEEQRKSGKGNGADSHRGTLDGLEKGGPVDGQYDTGDQCHRIIFFAIQFQPASFHPGKGQQSDRRPDYPAASDDHRGGVHELSQNGGKTEKHYCEMEQ